MAISRDASNGKSGRNLSVLGTLAFSIIVPGTVSILIPWMLIAGDPGVRPPGGMRLLGLGLVLAGAGLYFWSAWGFAWVGRGTPLPAAAPVELVVWGPYRYVRNPMYLAVLAVLAGEAIVFSSLRVAVLAFVLWPIFHLFVIGYEERRLTKRFGEPYRKYCARVGRWIPSPANREAG